MCSTFHNKSDSDRCEPFLTAPVPITTKSPCTCHHSCWHPGLGPLLPLVDNPEQNTTDTGLCRILQQDSLALGYQLIELDELLARPTWKGGRLLRCLPNQRFLEKPSKIPVFKTTQIYYLKFSRSAVQNMSQRLKSNYWQSWTPSGGSRRQWVFLLFSVSKGCLNSLANGSYPHPQGQQYSIF